MFYVAGIELNELPKASSIKLTKAVFCLHGPFNTELWAVTNANDTAGEFNKFLVTKVIPLLTPLLPIAPRLHEH